MKTRHLIRGLLVLLAGGTARFGLALCTGCLSMSVVPQAEDDGPKADSGVPVPACGAYCSNDCHCRGRCVEGECVGPPFPCEESCEGMCVDGECTSLPMELPACTPGKIEACIYRVSGEHGEISSHAFAGEYVYWVERGTTDDFNNPNYDGVLARTKVGEWGREVVASDLDLFDKTRRRLRKAELRVIDRITLIFDSQTDSRQPLYMVDLDRGYSAPFPAKSLQWHRPCVQGNRVFYIEHEEPGWSYREASFNEDGELSTKHLFISELTEKCAVHGNALYVGRKGKPVGRFELTTGTFELLSVAAEQLFESVLNSTAAFTVLRDSRIGICPIAELLKQECQWTAVSGPATPSFVDDQYLYAMSDPEITRVRVDGVPEAPQVVAEGRFYIPPSMVQSSGVVQLVGDGTGLRFLPFPPPLQGP